MSYTTVPKIYRSIFPKEPGARLADAKAEHADRKQLIQDLADSIEPRFLPYDPKEKAAFIDFMNRESRGETIPKIRQAESELLRTILSPEVLP
jgi:hypothetical protein